MAGSKSMIQRTGEQGLATDEPLTRPNDSPPGPRLYLRWMRGADTGTCRIRSWGRLSGVLAGQV